MAWPLLAAQAALLAVDPLSRSLSATFGLWAASLGALGWAIYRAGRGPEPTAGAILAVAFTLRALALPLEPALSDDVKRYLWDGRVTLAGENPYRHAPEAPELAGLRDEMFSSLPHRSVPTVYPPLAMAGFSIAALSPAPILCWKGLVAAVDLLGVWFLLRIARRRDLGAARCLGYAWHPLLVWEGAGMGHVDVVGVAACLAAVWFLLAGRARGAGVAAAAGVLAKLAPLVALPLWSRGAAYGVREGGRRFLLVATVLVVAAFLPVVLSVGGVPPGLLVYAKSWEFNGPLHEPLWRAFDVLSVDQWIKAGLATIGSWTGASRALDGIFPYLYPQLLAKLALLPLAAFVLWRSVRPADAPVDSLADLPAATGRLFAGVLLASATFYPWYALWILPWAALCRHRAWLLAMALLPLAYLPQLAGVAYFPWIWLAIWGPPALLALAEPRFRRWSSV